jgi:glycosyltransferase involved in cell wall biosynthesis
MNAVSIVVCTYNNAASLARTFDSFRAMDIPAGTKAEFCIIDNNSSDGTKRVCEEFAKSAPLPVRYFFEGKQGLSHARNRAIGEAGGDILIFTDDDVVVDRRWLAEFERSFREHSADAVFGPIRPEWLGHVPPWFSSALNAPYALLDYGPHAFRVTARRHEFYGANFGVRKRALLQAGGFDVSLGRTPDRLGIGEDLRLFLALFEGGQTIIYDPSIFVYHVIAEGRKSREFMLRYHADVASSLVQLADVSPSRQLFGVPYFRVREFAGFYALLPWRMLREVVRGTDASRFALRLRAVRTGAMLKIYARRWVSQ